jgi:hypothetical protein
MIGFERGVVASLRSMAGEFEETTVRCADRDLGKRPGFDERAAFRRIHFTMTKWPHVTEFVPVAANICVRKSPAHADAGFQ